MSGGIAVQLQNELAKMKYVFFIGIFFYVGYTSDDLKAFLCQSDWWDHSFTICEYKYLFSTICGVFFSRAIA